MTSSRKRWTKKETERVLQLRQKGLNYKEIADIIRPGQKTAWRKVGDICRENGVDKDSATDHQEESGIPQDIAINTLINLQRDERINLLMGRLTSSARGKAIMLALDDDQKRLFVEMYEENIRELDSLTHAEDQMLMTAILAYCQYVRAAQTASYCEQAFLMDTRGELEQEDPRRRLAGASDKYKKEMEQKHKEYVSLMDKLKLSRDQRLKSVVDQKKTFGEVQKEFISVKKRKSIAAEIIKIQQMTDDELKRLIQGGVSSDGTSVPWLIGEFKDE